MNENRREAYLQLIQTLMTCASGEEGHILENNQELVDAGLVQTMEQAVVVMAEKNYLDTAQFLHRFATNVAKKTGFSSPISIDKLEKTLHFLAHTLQKFVNNQGEPQVVYPLLEANLDKLNDNLASILRVWVNLTFPLVTLPEAQTMAYWVAGFSAVIKSFPQGNRSSHVEIAIAGLESALQILTRDDFPREWGVIQNDLGNCYKERVQGVKAKNVEYAITCYHNALQIRTRIEFPEPWAITQFNLGQAYFERIQGNRAENLKQAIACYENALQIFHSSTFPKQVAMIENNRKVAHDLLNGGINLAIQPLTTLSKTEQKFLISVLQATQYSHGSPLGVYPLLQANLDKLDDNFAQLLRIWTTSTLATVSPNQATSIAAIIYNFSNLMLDFPLGNKATNVKIAIVGYEMALQVCTPETLPKHWAEIQIHLGIAYEENPSSDAEKWEKAIACYEKAGQVFTRENDPEFWATVQDNLGNAYRNRIHGDKKDNLEKAIAFHGKALQVRTRQDDPQYWAITINNLASDYMTRSLCDDFAPNHSHLAPNYCEREQDREKAIAFFEESFTVLTLDVFPEHWALAHLNLGNVYAIRLSGNLTKNLQNAIQSYEKALQVYTVETHPHQHEQVLVRLRPTQEAFKQLAGDTAVESFKIEDEESQEIPFVIQVLGAALRNQDNPQCLALFLEANLDKLNEHFVQQLQNFGLRVVRILETMPADLSVIPLRTHFFEFVTAMTVFCSSMIVFSSGKKATNLNIAKAGYESILRLFTPEKVQERWAAIQWGLGTIYYERYQHRVGNRAENLELSIDYYQKALQMFTCKDFPEPWAAVQMALGLAYYYRIRENKTKNQETAIKAYKLALQVYTREAYQYDWARTQNNLGIVYKSRHKGIKANNLEDALSCYERALQVLTRQAFPQDWAMVQMNLASVYTDRVPGNVADNLEQAIICCNNALPFRTYQAFDKGWADTQVILGMAYYRRGLFGGTQRAEDFEQSIKCLEKAEEVWTRDGYPEEWAKIQLNLGITYSDRVNGQLVDNLEKSIEYLEKALEILNRYDFSYDRANIQRNLAVIYQQRLLGNRWENLERSIDFCQKAEHVFTKDNSLAEWALIQRTLGTAYHLLSEIIHLSERAVENLEKAISYYQLALLTPATHKRQWKRAIQFELGTCYKNLGTSKNSADLLEKSIDMYQQALRETDRNDPINRFERANIQNSLGNVYRHRFLGDKAENRCQAITYFENALQVRTRKAFPKDYVVTLNNIGHLESESNQFSKAYDRFKEAIDTVESMRGEITSSDEAKRKLDEEWNKLYQWMVKVCLELGNNAEALEYVERSKARNLVELMESRELPKGQIPDNLWTEHQQLRIKITAAHRRLEYEEGLARFATQKTNLDLEIPFPDHTELHQLQQQYHDLLDEISRTVPSFTLTQLKVEKLPYFGIRELLPNNQTAIIEWYVSEYHQVFYTFIMTRQSLQPIVLKSALKDFEDLGKWTLEYMTSYWEKEKRQQWQDKLTSRLKYLASILRIEEIIAQIPTCDQVILIPHRHLHLFPLHALPFADGECLLDKFETVRYAPSCQLLQQVQQQQRPNLSHCLAVQNPTNDLSFADLEVELIRSFFSTHEVLEKQTATKVALNNNQRLSSIHCCHFSCHGTFNLESPLESALLLANEERLTLVDIFGLSLNQCRLVTLSACETGLTDPTSISDEYIGLPSGFLYAGCANVVSSLWTVNQVSTAFLMIKFYQNLTENQSNVAKALNDAQRWLRDATKAQLQAWANQLPLGPAHKVQLLVLFNEIKSAEKPYQSPYHWAVFCAIGQ
jgi:CHAT domain-containing protein